VPHILRIYGLPLGTPQEILNLLLAQRRSMVNSEFLYKMILRHGCPLEIVSDLGREFATMQLVDLLEELTGFKQRHIEAG